MLALGHWPGAVSRVCCYASTPGEPGVVVTAQYLNTPTRIPAHDQSGRKRSISAAMLDATASPTSALLA
jgi:hypothetical protein